jgi:hypothetical protein
VLPARRAGCTAAAFVAACVAGAPAAFAQPPATPPDAQKLPEPAREATPTANPWVFSSDAGMMILFIKSDRTADFETAFAHARHALLESDNPERRRQGAGWTIFKAREPGPAASAIYVSLMNPVVKDADYSLGSLIADASAIAGNADPKTSIYVKYLDSFYPPAVNLLHLTVIDK